MIWVFLIVLVGGAMSSQFASRRLRAPLYALSTIGLGLFVIWQGWWINGYVMPGITGLFLILMVPFFLLVGRGNRPREISPRTVTPLRFAARLLRGKWAWNARKGYLELDGGLVRFVDLEGQKVFESPIGEVEDVSFPLFRGAQFRLAIRGERYAVALGHSSQEAFPMIRDARDLLRSAFEHRRRHRA